MIHHKQKGLTLLEMLMSMMIAGIISIGLFQFTYFATKILIHQETSVDATTESKLALEAMTRDMRSSHEQDIEIIKGNNFECLKTAPITHYGIIDKGDIPSKQIQLYPAFPVDFIKYYTLFNITSMQLRFSSRWLQEDFFYQEALTTINNSNTQPKKGLIDIVNPTAIEQAKTSLSPLRLSMSSARAKRAFVSMRPIYYCFVGSASTQYDELKKCQTETQLSFQDIQNAQFKDCTRLDIDIHHDPISPMTERFTVLSYKHIKHAYVQIGYYKMLPQVSDTARLPFRRYIQVHHAFL
tara:strand:+ start:1153 stop:2040 length:888 start_codon:yes stop_codon:yes gene_type:complete